MIAEPKTLTELFPLRTETPQKQPMTKATKSYGEARNTIQRIFENGGEYSVNQVVERLKGKVKEGTVRSTMASLKANGWLREARKEGRESFLRKSSGQHPTQAMTRGAAPTSDPARFKLAKIQDAYAVIAQHEKIMRLIDKEIQGFKKRMKELLEEM